MARHSAFFAVMCLLVQTTSFAIAEIPSDVKLALAARDFAPAVAWLTTHSSEPDAAFELGKLFRLGKGVARDLQHAAELFEVAAQAGNLEAQYLLGKYHEREGETEQSEHWMRIAAALGHKRAGSWLASDSRSVARLSLLESMRAGKPPPVVKDQEQVNVEDDFGRTALMEAAEQGSHDWVGYMIDAEARVNTQDQLGNTALHYAVSCKALRVVELLVSAGADVNLAALDGASPLHLAVGTERVDIVAVLLKSGADVEAKNAAGWSSRMLALRSSDEAMKAAFGIRSSTSNKRLSRIADVQQSQPLLINAAQRGDIELVRELISKGINVDVLGEGGYSPLAVAMRNGHTEVARLLVNEGAAIDTVFGNGQTLLHLVAEYSRPESMALIKAGAGVDALDSQQRSPLMLAALSGCVPCVAQLLSRGASTSLQDDHGQSALIIALRNDHTQLAMRLVSATDRLDLEDDSGRTALWWACRRGHADIAAALIERPAATSADNDDVNPLHVAAEGNQAELVGRLLTLVDIDSESRSGNTPLLLAAHAGSTEALSRLITAGADLEVKNILGDTALIAAVRSGDLLSTELLLAAGANRNSRNDRFESARSLIEQREEPQWIKLLEEVDGGLFGLFGSLTN